MRRRTLLIGLCLATLLSVMATPALAGNRPRSGDRILLGSAPASFAANAPFHIEHGFLCALGHPEDDPDCMSEQIGRGNFELYVDGVLQRSTIDVRVENGAIARFWLTNFMSGLPAGTHTFVGKWYQVGSLILTATVDVDFS